MAQEHVCRNCASRRCYRALRCVAGVSDSCARVGYDIAMSRDFDPESLSAFDEVFTHESLTANEGLFRQRLSQALAQVLRSHEPQWRRSLDLEDSILRHETAAIHEVLMDISQANPAGVRALTLHWFVGLSLDETAHHVGWSITQTREKVGMTLVVVELQLQHFSSFRPSEGPADVS